MGKRFGHFALTWFIAMIPCACGAASAAAEDGAEVLAKPTYRSAVSEVRLVFFATDEQNHNVGDLQKNDFAVVDNERVIREFRGFARANLTRLNVVVLIDASESVLPQVRSEIADTLQLMAQSPWSSDDNISVLSFSGMDVQVVCRDDCREVDEASRFESLPRGGATPLFDALQAATKLLAQRAQPDRWPVIVVFSDGEDTISRTSFAQALQNILVAGAQVYAVDVATPAGQSKGSATLQKIADDTGGRYLRIGDAGAGVFEQFIEDLHSAQVVTYVSPESHSDFHSVRIYPTHNLNLRFHSRRGYYRDSDRASSEDTR
jgi:VWFA-related protein